LDSTSAQQKALPPIGTQPQPGTKPPESLSDPTGQTSNINLLVDDKKAENARGLIEAINDNIEVQEWAKVVDLLQKLLDNEEDVYAKIKTKGPDNKISENIVNVRLEANRLVASLPDKGMEMYRTTHNAKASTLLKEAKANNNDAPTLAKILNRYLYTDSGAEACTLLATYHLDRGNYPSAALCFEKLIRRDSAKKMSSNTLFRAALAFHYTGQKDQEELCWKELEDKTKELTLGRVKKPVSELKEYVASIKSEGTEFQQFDRLMVGGGPSRNRPGVGTTAFLKPRWSEELITEAATKQLYVDAAENFIQAKGQPILSPAQPIAVTIQRDGKPLPLVVYRSYKGIHARNVKTGELEWEADSAWSIDKVERMGKFASTFRQWKDIYIGNQAAKPEILFENSVVGTLSTDNTRVFVVEDLAMPPYTMHNPYDYSGRPQTYGGKVGEAINHSRLQAYDLDSGKLLWELGDTGTKDKDDLLDMHFLGAPLPLNNKLYVLTEKNQTLRLLTIDPSNGKLLSKPQRLADTADKLSQNTSRRIHAAHLAYGEGILVLPTNAGAIIGVDLLTNSLVWAYPYLEGQQASTTPQPGKPWGGVPIDPNTGMPIRQVPLLNNWKNTPPMIVEGKVIFAAPDATSVHCVNLQSGKRMWKVTRAESDIYLAGVFNGKALIVGKNYCRGLDINDSGKELFRVETGVPSGFGIASDGMYYLPMASAIDNKEPGICIIDIAKGQKVAHTRSRLKEIPGNLLFYEGDVLSQTTRKMSVYPQLDVELKTVDALIAKNPKDPDGLVRRGDLRLDKGDLKGAIEDLRVALDQPTMPKELQPKARAKLFESFTEYFQRDFTAAEKYLKEYEGMCSVPGDPAEEKRRKGNYYCLLGKGREEQKKLVEAFEAYINFGTLGADNELMNVVDQPAVKAAPSVWAQGRIATMVAKATPEDRKPLEDLITKKWEEVKKGDIETMRGFVSTFGSMLSIGREARLTLAERLIESTDTKSLLDAERHLGILRAQKEDPGMSGRAVEALARLMTRKGLMEDAAYYYRVLGRDYASVKVKNDKTGQEYFNELATDKRFLPYLDDGSRFGSAKFTAPKEAVRSQNTTQQRYYRLDCDGEPLPYFRKYELKMALDYNQLKVLEAATGKEYWSEGIEQTYFSTVVQQQQYGVQRQVRFPYQNIGHLVVVQLGHMAYALDPVNKTVLWKKNLSGQTNLPGYKSHTYDPRDHTPVIAYTSGWTQRLGQAGPLSPTAVVLQTNEGLESLDPITGRTMWKRNDLPKACHIFNDSEYVYVVEVGESGNAGATKAIRIYDGYEMKVRDFSSEYTKRTKIYGRLLVVNDTDAKGGVLLRLYDVLEGKDVWSQSFPAGSQVLKPERGGVIGAVEPDGKVTIYDVTAREVMLKTVMDPEHIAKATSLILLKDAYNVYVACNQPIDRQLLQFGTGGLMFNLMPGSGMQAVPINGEVYAWDLNSGKLKWHNPLPNQMIILDQFQELPLLMATVRYYRWVPGQVNRQQELLVHTQTIDKRTGKLVFNHQYRSPNQDMYQFHAMNVDAKGGKIELLSIYHRVTHEIATEGGSGGTKPVTPMQGTTPSSGPKTGTPDLQPPPPPIRQIEKR